MSLTIAPVLFALLSACGTSERPILSDVLIGSCDYTSPFTQRPECRDYLGAWTLDQAEADCAGLGSTLVPDAACDTPDVLGWCLTDSAGQQMRVAILGDDVNRCGSSKTGCEFFGGGYWDPAPLCADANEIIVPEEDAFPRPVKICADPLPGEPPGQGPDGQVCTWEMISGATEEGRVFSDYASCDTVRQQRPYRAVPPNERYTGTDPRMDDPDYAAEVEWVRGQLRSAACLCCHDQSAPDGPSVFDADAPGNLLNQFNDRGIAMGAGWISTVGFGAYPPEENNGFERADLDDPNHSIFPTTDMTRMIAIFTAEAAYRGMDEKDFAGVEYGAGPLDEFRQYDPQPCTEDEGVDENGVLRWLPGRARYVSILEKDAISPTVPPNLEVPEGTLWRMTLDVGEQPVPSESLEYGEGHPAMTQMFPAKGKPKALTSGKTYYLHAMADVLTPISRCLFVAP